MNVSFQGIDSLAVTFQTSGTVKKGDFVSLRANGAVGTCAPGEAPVGLVLGCHGDLATVQLRGYAEAGYTGTMGLGWGELAVESGKLRQPTGMEDGRRCLVVWLDTAAKTMGLFLC